VFNLHKNPSFLNCGEIEHDLQKVIKNAKRIKGLANEPMDKVAGNETKLSPKKLR
jgi:hypothetical protein